jgi:hypothetical protein
MSGRLRLSLAVGALVGALVGVVAVAPGAGAKPKGQALVMPVQSNVHGRSYGEWSAAWWQWAFSIPGDHHPLTDTADCSVGQSDHVWFLGGSFAAVEQGGEFVGIARRSCTVPTGTFLFVPVINAEASTLEGDGTTESELRATANSLQDLATDMSMTIDDISVPVGDNQSYRVESPLFTYGPLPENNLLDADAGLTSPAVGDGVYVMVKPLAVGEHTIHFAGKVAAPTFTFRLDITYNITVAPGHH